MAARLRQHHQEDIKKKIQIGNIINRLQKHINGEVEMSQTQVTSAKILLDKSLSNAPTEVKADVDVDLTVEIVKFAGKAP
jgi:hypothetical protein